MPIDNYSIGRSDGISSKTALRLVTILVTMDIKKGSAMIAAMGYRVVRRSNDDKNVFEVSKLSKPRKVRGFLAAIRGIFKGRK